MVLVRSINNNPKLESYDILPLFLPPNLPISLNTNKLFPNLTSLDLICAAVETNRHIICILLGPQLKRVILWFRAYEALQLALPSASNAAKVNNHLAWDLLGNCRKLESLGFEIMDGTNPSPVAMLLKQNIESGTLRDIKFHVEIQWWDEFWKIMSRGTGKSLEEDDEDEALVPPIALVVYIDCRPGQPIPHILPITPILRTPPRITTFHLRGNSQLVLYALDQIPPIPMLEALVIRCSDVILSLPARWLLEALHNYFVHDEGEDSLTYPHLHTVEITGPRPEPMETFQFPVFSFEAAANLVSTSVLDDYFGSILRPGMRRIRLFVQSQLNLTSEMLERIRVVCGPTLDFLEVHKSITDFDFPSREELGEDEDWIGTFPRPLTLGQLIGFTRSCPKIKYLHLGVDASNGKEISELLSEPGATEDVITECPLEVLHVGSSWISMDDAESLAQLIRREFPKLEMLWWIVDPAGPEENPKRLSYLNAWAKVEELLGIVPPPEFFGNEARAPG